MYGEVVTSTNTLLEKYVALLAPMEPQYRDFRALSSLNLSPVIAQLY